MKSKSIKSSQLSRQLVTQYFLAAGAATLILIFFLFIFWQIARSFIWQPYDPLYQILSWIKFNIFGVSISCLLVCWIILTFIFIKKTLSYLDEIIAGAQKLATPNTEQIKFSSQLRTIEDEMNLIREQALRNIYLMKEAEKRKNDLIVYLAHDLKTPLTSVIGYLNLLNEEPQISTQLRAKYTQIALEKAERLEELINEFFEVARFNLTAIELDTKLVNLSRMIEQMMDEFNPILKIKQLTWQTKITPKIKFVCDPDKMGRVFDNLFTNAINYSDEGTEIEVELKKSKTDLIIEIKNHGQSIAPEKMKRIFEQFYRLDTARSSKTGGAGLGLAITKEIVELHGGSIAAASHHQAITFTVTLPLNEITS